MWVHSSGMLGRAHRGFRLADASRHFAPFLGRSGFDTVLCGIQHEGRDAAELGYSQALPDARPVRADFARYRASTWDELRRQTREP
jgi:hypothetical protein